MPSYRRPETGDSERTWSIGALAGSAGVTVRTLRHYDQIGLLSPAHRSGSGHRRYDHSDLRRLYQILALRSLGFDLASIGRLLAETDVASLLQTARRHLADVSAQALIATDLESKLRAMVETLKAARHPSSHDLLTAMEVTSMTIRLTRIYTRAGDDGQTSLGTSVRVPKTHPVVEAGGAVDEVNSHIGAAIATGEIAAPYVEWLRQVQNELFDLGADISVPIDVSPERPRLRLSAAYVDRLEHWCDHANEALEPLDSFILPGGSPTAAQLHIARAVCRRAERRVLNLAGVNPQVVRYLNRLSDLLFILTRTGADQPLWQPAATATA